MEVSMEASGSGAQRELERVKEFVAWAREMGAVVVAVGDVTCQFPPQERLVAVGPEAAAATAALEARSRPPLSEMEQYIEQRWGPVADVLGEGGES